MGGQVKEAAKEVKGAAKEVKGATVSGAKKVEKTVKVALKDAKKEVKGAAHDAAEGAENIIDKIKAFFADLTGQAEDAVKKGAGKK